VSASRRTHRDERRRRLGQNFLRPDVADHFVDGADIRAGDLVLEIGAGNGAIAVALARRGADVVALEADPVWAERLRQRVRGLRRGRVQVVAGDFFDAPLPATPFRVVGSLPFGRTTDMLRRLFDRPRAALTGLAALAAHGPRPGRQGPAEHLDILRRDLVLTARSCRRHPTLAATIVITLAAAIGLNTAVFSVVDGVLLRALPFDDGGRLVRVYELSPERERTAVAAATFLDWTAAASTFEAMVLVGNDRGLATKTRWRWQGTVVQRLIVRLPSCIIKLDADLMRATCST
jgi:predicted RNA methylase